jgi:outer membrane protein OmpA-like peptidoglycan-associated protein
MKRNPRIEEHELRKAASMAACPPEGCWLTRALALSAVLAALHSGAAVAQSDKVLKGREITENALIEALTPEGEPVERMRSIRVAPDRPAPAERVAAAPKRASASLLITFETNSAELTPRARSSLDVVGRALNADKLADFKFSIEGHADPRGGPEFNLKLSQARAESVVQYLVEQHKISPERLKPIGKGESELLNTANPLAPENRRVTIVTVPN